MIARNYRQYPEALLYQLELVLGDVANTIEGIRIRGGAPWTNLVKRFYGSPADVRGMVAVPAWLKAAKWRARTMALAVKAAQLSFL